MLYFEMKIFIPNITFLQGCQLNVIQKVVKCPPNHMTFAPAKFEIATSNSLGEDAFTRKYTIDM